LAFGVKALLDVTAVKLKAAREKLEAYRQRLDV
jgi:hypothetical protein